MTMEKNGQDNSETNRCKDCGKPMNNSDQATVCAECEESNTGPRDQN